MNILVFSAVVWVASMLAGFLGALTGLGGGVVIVPLLALAFHVDLRYAIGASLVSVIATSSGAAASYVRDGYSNIRVGMFLEIATTAGAICGAHLAGFISKGAIGIVLGCVLLYSAIASLRPPKARIERSDGKNEWSKRLHMDSSYPTQAGPQRYHVKNLPIGFGIMSLAGILSGLLGIGSGAFKVLALDRAMGMPFKAATTTSNFMIGVTAAASAGLYLHRGYIDPGLSMPVMLGVLIGSTLGARVLMKAQSGLLRIVFAAVIIAMGVQMIYSGATGKL